MKYRVERSGNIVVIRALGRKVQAWLEDNCASEGWQWIGRGLAVDVRCAGDIIEGLNDAGFVAS